MSAETSTVLTTKAQSAPQVPVKPKHNQGDVGTVQASQSVVTKAPNQSMQEISHISETPKVSAISARRNRSRRKGTAFPALERRNWLIHMHYVRKDYARCRDLIEEQIKETKNRCEYPLHVKAMILRVDGDIQQSLKLFQRCHQINQSNPENLKQIGKNLILLGRHKSAIECYKTAMGLGGKDWQICQALGICAQFLKDYKQAEAHFSEALTLSRHVITYQLLSNLHLDHGEVASAKHVLEKGIHHYGDNVELLTSLGVLYLQAGDFHRAFELLGKSLTYDPENYKAILAAGSLMQQHGDFDVALSKYRAAAQSCPESSSLWNNIAMCFFGKKKLVAAISCLKRAHYLSPFDWRILYNLSLLHLTMQQFASSFQFASTALTLKREDGGLYMLLAISLAYLGQENNANQAFQQALALSGDDPHILVNFASFLHHTLADSQQASQILSRFKKIKKDSPDFDKEVLDASKKLMVALNIADDGELGKKSSETTTDKKKKRKEKRDSAAQKSDSKGSLEERNLPGVGKEAENEEKRD